MRNTALMGCLIAIAGSAHANLVVNGSFEDPYQGGGWGAFASIPGWTALSDGVEIGEAGVYGVTGQDLHQVLEPDYTSNAIVEQMVGTTPSQSYALSFLVAQRAGVAPASCQIDVWWNGALLDSITPTSTVMALHSYTVAASSASTSLQFRGAGAADSLGGLVDDVRLEAVPEPATMAALAIGVVGFARKRRK